MPIAERDYMKDRQPEPEPIRIQNAHQRRVVIFRWLVIIWLVYLTVHTHDMNAVFDRSVEILSDVQEATVEFLKTIKVIIFKEK